MKLVFLLLVGVSFAGLCRSEESIQRNESDSTVNEWIAGLDSKDVVVQMVTINKLADLGLAAAPAIPKLILLVRAEHHCVCQNAVRVLVLIGPPAMQALIAKFNDEEDEEKGIMVWPNPWARAVACFGKKAVPTLCGLLLDKNKKVAVLAIEALEEIGDKDGLPALQLASKSTDELIRMSAKAAIYVIQHPESRM